MPSPARGFVHDALIYSGDDDYLGSTIPFIEEGLSAGEAVMVAVPDERIELISSRVAVDADPLLRLVSMEKVGRNPSWIISAMNDFVRPHVDAGRPVRGIGEPAWAGRTDDELEECARHEMLLNLAFGDAAGFSLLCPYDAAALPPAVIDQLQHDHPFVNRGGTRTGSELYRSIVPELADTPLPPVPESAVATRFDAMSLSEVRHLAGKLATAAGVPSLRVDDLLLAVSELLTNTIRHAGGCGEITMWDEGGRFVCEVRDSGRITDPLAGRIRPTIDGHGGRGLWLVNQLCDLVQVRALPEGQAIRVQVG